MLSSSRLRKQQGFTLIEMMIAITVMIVLTAAVLSLMGNSMKVATSTFEMTDAEEGLRTAQEYISRDLVNAGDGLKTILYIPVPKTFVQNYLTLTPIVDATDPNVINLGILTTDNNVTAGTAVRDSAEAVTVRSTPVLTDRQTILEQDRDFTEIALAASAINPTTGAITVTDRRPFTSGANEVYFLLSTEGGAFCTLKNVTAGGGNAGTLDFGNGDFYGLNTTGANGPIGKISKNGTVSASLLRMKMIHYYINSNGRLMRRVFGVKGAGFRESAITEHVVNVQFLYSLDLDSSGNPVQPVNRLTTLEQQVQVSQVEVTVTVETPHALQNGQRPQISAATSSSLRNMQFRKALQPSASPTP